MVLYVILHHILKTKNEGYRIAFHFDKHFRLRVYHKGFTKALFRWHKRIKIHRFRFEKSIPNRRFFHFL